jgi:hypothetical protein
MTRWGTLSWGLWTAFVLTLGLAIYIGFNPATGPPIRLVDAIWAASFIGFPTAGALIAPRMPGRPLGWMLLLAPLLLMTALTLSDLAVRWDGEATGRWVLWVATVCFAAGLGPLLAVPLYLPDGELPSPRWRKTAAAVWSLFGVSVFHAAFKPGALEVGRPGIDNPLGLEALGPWFRVIEAALGPLFLLTLAVGVVSLVVRFRGSAGIERQQLKWLALGGGALLSCFASIAVIQAFVGDLGDVAVTLIIALGILCLPLSIGVAVLRTRLYDIDLIVNRTLVYGSVTAILAAAYFGLVVLLRGLLDPVTGDSDLAVAGSTLAVAALARPALQHVRGFIDRRFYRTRYDATETLNSFSARLRDQIDLDALQSELVTVVGSTMQPAHASLWLRRENV